jgi:amino acid transporter
VGYSPTAEEEGEKREKLYG